MFHTFRVPNAHDKDGGDEREDVTSARPLPLRRVSTTNACTECRRRKIRCGGSLPCQQCQWYRQPDLCRYAEQSLRLPPSKRLLERLQSKLESATTIVERLFPGLEVDGLLLMSRNELIELAASSQTSTESPVPLAVDDHSQGATSTPAQRSEESDSLAELEQAPRRELIAQDSPHRRITTSVVSDDVNGLSLSTEHSFSYLGISSINAALKIMFKLAPGLRSYVSQGLPPSEVPTRMPSPSSEPSRDEDATALPTPDVALEHIESYFSRVHILMPMIDEEEFRHTYFYSNRNDSPWLALLNMVLALGSLSSGDCRNEEHLVYYKRASKHMVFESFGSNSLAMLQALGLLGGYYLHWLNRPNEAHALMGAALRMAIAFGLHREYHTTSTSNKAEIPVETRRRTWWTLVCLDTLAAMTTGRPSLGRLGRGITVQLPIVPEQTNNAQYLASLKLLPSFHNVVFCRMATRVQDRLAEQTILGLSELTAFDAELVAWYSDLPPILRNDSEVTMARNASGFGPSKLEHLNDLRVPKPSRMSKADVCPAILRTPRAIMHWWYLTLRMLMHRPMLLAFALRTKPCSSFTIEEKETIHKCRTLAGDLIMAITSTCRDELIAGWNAVWIIYQAVMVPLISLWSHATHAQESEPGLQDNAMAAKDHVEQWRTQVRITIEFMDRMAPYSLTGGRIKVVIARLLEASDQPDLLHSFNGTRHQHDSANPAVFTPQLRPREQSTTAAQQSSGAGTLVDDNVPAENIFQFDAGYSGSTGHIDLPMAWDDMLWQSDSLNLFSESYTDGNL